MAQLTKWDARWPCHTLVPDADATVATHDIAIKPSSDYPCVAVVKTHPSGNPNIPDWFEAGIYAYDGESWQYTMVSDWHYGDWSVDNMDVTDVDLSFGNGHTMLAFTVRDWKEDPIDNTHGTTIEYASNASGSWPAHPIVISSTRSYNDWGADASNWGYKDIEACWYENDWHFVVASNTMVEDEGNPGTGIPISAVWQLSLLQPIPQEVWILSHCSSVERVSLEIHGQSQLPSLGYSHCVHATPNYQVTMLDGALVVNGMEPSFAYLGNTSFIAYQENALPHRLMLTWQNAGFPWQASLISDVSVGTPYMAASPGIGPLIAYSYISGSNTSNVRVAVEQSGDWNNVVTPSWVTLTGRKVYSGDQVQYKNQPATDPASGMPYVALRDATGFAVAQPPRIIVKVTGSDGGVINDACAVADWGTGACPSVDAFTCGKGSTLVYLYICMVPQIPGQQIIVRVWANGYKSAEQTCTLSLGSIQNVHFTLEPGTEKIGCGTQPAAGSNSGSMRAFLPLLCACGLLVLGFIHRRPRHN
jgi:hypothetical protein